MSQGEQRQLFMQNMQELRYLSLGSSLEFSDSNYMYTSKISNNSGANKN